MARLRPCKIDMVTLDSGKGCFGKMRQALSESEIFPRPDFVISTGHSTHLPLLRVALKYRSLSICLMKPSVPSSWFDWCIAPEHDFKSPPAKDHIIRSKGALNRVCAGNGEKSGRLFLIGGPSKTHGYDEMALIAQIEEISASGNWEVADSRRTPGTFLPALEKSVPGLKIFSHAHTQAGWLAAKLGEVEEIRVTEDSVSMIYEALSSGAKVGILEMPRLRPDTRVIRGLEMLRADGWFSGERAQVLAEADRCAEIILKAEGHIA